MSFYLKTTTHLNETIKQGKSVSELFKPYRKPRLLQLGNLLSLTLGASPGFPDDSGFPVNTQPPV